MAAGLGFKNFTTGEVLTAGDVNGYLMQGVLVFADAAARTAAITSPQEGQLSFLKDTNSTEYYSGSAWVAVGGSVPESLEYSAGKNKIINGAFNVWQRGTSFTPANTAYTADRWFVDATTAYPTSQTISQQTFTPGTAPVSGYESSYFLRYVYSYAPGNPGLYLGQKIEDVRSFAGQTVTVSFWAKVASAAALNVNLVQNFGSGGSTSVTTSVGTPSATTSWQRFSYTVAVPSISGKTIGTSSFLELRIFVPNASSTTDFWGVQVEAGSTATSFQTATGTIQGELAACQRYFWRAGGDSVQDRLFGNGIMVTTTTARHLLVFPVQMRTPSTITPSAASTFYVYGGAGAQIPTAIAISAITQQNCTVDATRSTSTIGQASMLQAVGTANAYIDVSGEL